MRIEDEFFQRSEVDLTKLYQYGFLKKENQYWYSKKITDDFMAEIIVGEDQCVTGHIYDLSTNEEYTYIYIKNQTGTFVNQIKEAYQNLLYDIARNCFHRKYFIGDQANRIANMIETKYQGKPEFMWERYPLYGVFRNSSNEKWYALIARIDQKKLGLKTSSEVDIINLKVDRDQIKQLLIHNGIYEAYHMNKKNWVSIILDDTLSDKEVMKYVIESYDSVAAMKK